MNLTLPALLGATVLLAATLGPATPAAAAPAHRPPSGEVEVRRVLASMTLPEKVGQLFSTYAYGSSATTTTPAEQAQNQTLLGVDNAAELVAKYHVGGVIYFGYAGNLVDPTQIATLSHDLQQVASSTGARVPLLISTDQEGGSVTRIGAPLAVSPGNMALGATFSPRLAYQMSRATGQQLRALGIDADDAPVVDTNTNPANAADGPRAFGDTPAQTAAFGAASVRGYQSAGVSATAKHFPGLGSTEVNTDFGVATSDQTRAEFERLDLPAFRAAVAAGVDSIMAAHIVAPALDASGRPASLSEPMVTGILRDELHYDGVVVTDALNAEALSGYTNAERSVLALQAGVDQLLIPTDLAGSEQAVLDAVASGELSVARIDASVTRLLRQKQKLGLLTTPSIDPTTAAAKVGTPAQQAVSTRAARRSITLYRNDDGVLPLRTDPARSILVTGYGVTTTATLAADLTAAGAGRATALVTGSAPTEDAIAGAVTAAKGVDSVVVVTNNAWGAPGQLDLVRRLVATGTPVVVLAVGAPYEVGQLPGAGAVLASFGYQPVSLAAATAVILGAQPRGRSPITIRTADQSEVVARLGSGLRYHR